MRYEEKIKGFEAAIEDAKGVCTDAQRRALNNAIYVLTEWHHIVKDFWFDPSYDALLVGIEVGYATDSYGDHYYSFAIGERGGLFQYTEGGSRKYRKAWQLKYVY